MKIRYRLNLKYLAATFSIYTLFVVVVWAFSEKNRENEFFRDLRQEAITKANLYLSGKTDAATMQSIYLNNRDFIDEVEVAVYGTDFSLLYHDAQQIDIVQETPELIDRVIMSDYVQFYEDSYQAIAFLYNYNGKDYVITAAAFDGYGYKKLHSLTILLTLLWLGGLVVFSVAGYFFSRSALAPVSKIVDAVEGITENNLNQRLPVANEKDELGELALTFNMMLDRLERSFDNQKMFVSNVSHELRTPLAALIAELEVGLIAGERTGEQYQDMISMALSDAKSLNDLINGLMDLAVVGYDKNTIKFSHTRLDEIILDARSQLQRSNDRYRVELIFDTESDDDSWITVDGNDYLLRMAFLNLMENNCKFSDNNTAFVHISSYGNNAVIRFSDTGIGIPHGDIGKLFTPFFRGSNSGTIEGKGIGMALAHKIIEIHNGSIRVNSHVGEGTVFTVEIPNTCHR